MPKTLKPNWENAPEWATKLGKQHVVHGNYIPLWYNDERACSAIDVPNLSVLQALQFKPKNIVFVENRPT